MRPSTLDFEWSFLKYVRSCLAPKTNQKIMRMRSPSSIPIQVGLCIYNKWGENSGEKKKKLGD